MLGFPGPNILLVVLELGPDILLSVMELGHNLNSARYLVSTPAKVGTNRHVMGTMYLETYSVLVTVAGRISSTWRCTQHWRWR